MRIEQIGPRSNPLLTRYFLLQTPWGNMDLHVFHRSDADRHLHDHPWSFFTIPLWRGYTEVVPTKSWREYILAYANGLTPLRCAMPSEERHRRWPLIPLYRPANWAHRVELPEGKKAVSLIFTSRRRTDRDWGFYTEAGWIDWVTYHYGTDGKREYDALKAAM